VGSAGYGLTWHQFLGLGTSSRGCQVQAVDAECVVRPSAYIISVLTGTVTGLEP
jgi:hypothetical protein